MDRALTVLLVEDNPGDRRLTTETLKESGLTIKLCVVETGEEALEVLQGRSERFGAVPLPDLVLLDLGLPGMSGQDVLAAMREDARLAAVPVVVQTGNDDDVVLLETLGLGAHELVTKPITVEQLLGVIEYVTEYA